jgi:hypothetical protein
VTRKRSERPTVPPSFDVAQYAKDSDARLRRARAVTEAPPPPSEADAKHGAEPVTAPNSEVRLVTRPDFRPALTDEQWARNVHGTPYVVLPPGQLKRLPLGHRAGFLLSCIDGATDLETLVMLSSMPREETLRLARDLYESGIVAFRLK